VCSLIGRACPYVYRSSRQPLVADTGRSGRTDTSHQTLAAKRNPGPVDARRPEDWSLEERLLALQQSHGIERRGAGQ
jgi:hypothetical protein